MDRDRDLHGRLLRALAPHLARLLTPALAVDLDGVQHNARAMLARVGRPDRWRPHIKTVKQSAVLRILLQCGVRRFKCATLGELDVLLRTAADFGAPIDVLLAYPLSRPAFEGLLQRRARNQAMSVTVLADSPAHLRGLQRWAMDLEPSAPVGVHLDVDLGMGRTGTPPAIWNDALGSLPDSRHVELVGLHGYDGHLAWDERAAAHRGYQALCELAGAMDAVGLGPREVVTSGTHSYAHALAHAGLSSGPWLHQVSPGTIVLSDLRSTEAATDLGLRQAAFVATRVISGRPGAITLDAGSKAIAPDRPAPNCRILGHPELRPLAPSEEHLPVRVQGDAAPSLGSLLWLIPEHVCTTVNLYRRALWIRADEIVGDGPIEATGHTLWADEVLA